jgi:hypothetical protein
VADLFGMGQPQLRRRVHVPPAWHLQRGEDDPISMLAVGLDLDDLRNWLEREADSVTAKAVLCHYRPTPFRSAWARFLHYESFADTRSRPTQRQRRTRPRRRAATPSKVHPHSLRAPFRALATLDPVRDICGIFSV